MPTRRDRCPIITCAFCFSLRLTLFVSFDVNCQTKTFLRGLFFFKYERVINKKFGHFFLPLKIWLILSLKNSRQILNDLAQTPAAVEGKRNENTWKKGFRQPRTTSESLSLTLHQSGFRVICNLRIIFLMVLHKTNKKMSFYTFKERFLFNVSFQFWRFR